VDLGLSISPSGSPRHREFRGARRGSFRDWGKLGTRSTGAGGEPIQKINEAFDPTTAREQIVAIAMMDAVSVPTIAEELVDGKNENAGNYSLERVQDGVRIGMRRGGKYEPTGGFGWRDAADK
jgi:hypothetical protein